MTIDKFNLKLIRQFSRDLDLPGQFEVILEEKEKLEKQVEKEISDSIDETLTASLTNEVAKQIEDSIGQEIAKYLQQRLNLISNISQKNWKVVYENFSIIFKPAVTALSANAIGALSSSPGFSLKFLFNRCLL